MVKKKGVDEITQCDRPTTSKKAIESMTINAIRFKLMCYGERTEGCKVDLVERLQQRRALDTER
jgi:hypothetical protein